MPTQTQCLPAPRGAQGRAWLSPARCRAGSRAWQGGGHHHSKHWQCQNLLVRTAAMPEIAGASRGDAGVCQRAAAQSATGLAQHQPLQTPQTIFQLPGHVIAEFLRLRQILGRSSGLWGTAGDGALRGLRLPPFPRAGAGRCRLRLPRYRRVRLHPRECLIGLGQAEIAGRFPSPRRQIKRAGSTWRRPSPTRPWCGEEAWRRLVSLLSFLQLQRQTRESPEPRLPRRCHPPPPPFSLPSNLSHLLRCRRGPALFPASGWAGVKALRGRDGHSGGRGLASGGRAEITPTSSFTP